MLLKTSIPCLDISLKSVLTLVRLRSSSLVPFISHSTLVIVTDEDPQLYIALSSEIKTLPLEVLSITRNQKIRNTHYHYSNIVRPIQEN